MGWGLTVKDLCITRAQIKALFLEKLTKSLLTQFILSATQTWEETLDPGHYDLLFYEGEEDKPTKLPKVGS